MKTTQEIKQDLNDTVKIYHTLPNSTIERYKTDAVLNRIFFPIAELYDETIKGAPEILQTIYKYLYVEGLTQKDTAQALYYSQNYINQLHKELILFFQANLG